jgi:hypothetical protein
MMWSTDFESIPPELGGPTAKERLEHEAQKIGVELQADLDAEAQAAELGRYREMREIEFRQLELERKQRWWIRLVRWIER